MRIQDSTGHVTAALSKILNCPQGPLENKAMAMEEGVTFAWDVGVCDVVFEYDSKTVFDALNGFSEPPVSIANVIDRI